MCIATFPADVMAESSNIAYMEGIQEPSQSFPPDNDLVSRGFWTPTVVSAASFRSDGLNLDAGFFPFTGGYLYGSESGCYMAPVYLPQGATVTQINGSFYDNSTSNITANLNRVDNYTGVVTAMAGLATDGESTSIQNEVDITISEPAVLYPNFSYYITVCLNDGNTRVYSFRIYWTS